VAGPAETNRPIRTQTNVAPTDRRPRASARLQDGARFPRPETCRAADRAGCGRESPSFAPAMARAGACPSGRHVCRPDPGGLPGRFPSASNFSLRPTATERTRNSFQPRCIRKRPQRGGELRPVKFKGSLSSPNKSRTAPNGSRAFKAVEPFSARRAHTHTGDLRPSGYSQRRQAIIFRLVALCVWARHSGMRRLAQARNPYSLCRRLEVEREYRGYGFRARGYARPGMTMLEHFLGDLNRRGIPKGLEF
jgi:hypothetical protein